MGKFRDRTFTGCWKCRARKVKCDGKDPGCFACARLGVPCPGYGAKYIWVENDSQAQRSSGRSLLHCDATWKGFEILPSDVVDLLIAQCDGACSSVTDFTLDASPGTVIWPNVNHNPFSVFPAALPPVMEGHSTGAIDLKPKRRVPRTLPLTPNMSQLELHLFQYYLERTSNLMLPYEHPKNPWKNIYPAAAATSPRSADGNILYYAILAHAAFHLAHLRTGDASIYEVGPQYYDMAIVQLRKAIRSEDKLTPVMLASVLTLMYAEVYRGLPRNWTHHYRGAWSMMAQLSLSGPGSRDDLSTASVQSVGIVKIIGDTSRIVASNSHKKNDASDTEADRAAQSVIFATLNFGFTIGADSEIMRCISSITEFTNRRADNSLTQGCDEFIADTLAVLNRHRCKVESHSDSDDDCHAEAPEAAAQRGAFVYATYIYLYRTVLHAAPHVVRPHVAKTFSQVSHFYARSSGNFSFWPAFVAAAEAYTDEDIGMAKLWLDEAVALGLGNRVSAKMVLEKVWNERKEVSQRTGLDPGSVVVDWRATMQNMGTDVLLI